MHPKDLPTPEHRDELDELRQQKSQLLPLPTAKELNQIKAKQNSYYTRYKDIRNELEMMLRYRAKCGETQHQLVLSPEFKEELAQELIANGYEVLDLSSSEDIVTTLLIKW